MTDLYISEIFHSIQGESTHAGRKCTFVRLTGCNIHCTYCDTEYAVIGGVKVGVRTTQAEVLEKVAGFGTNLVEITGGEPLVQKAVIPLMKELIDRHYEVLLETNGAIDISEVPKAVNIIMDFKTPSSGYAHKNVLSNIDHLSAQDEIKFVVRDDEDYNFARNLIKRHDLDKRFTALISPDFADGDRRAITERLLDDNLNVRLNLQLHKFIWPVEMRGV